MKKFIRYILPAVALTLSLSACNNDEDLNGFESEAVDGGKGTIENTLTSVSALEFKWQPVEGAKQYGYTLQSLSSQQRRQGITAETHIRFEKLEQNTAYALTIEAFGSNGNPTYIFKTSATTAPIVELSAPDAASFRYEQSSALATITWDEVENATFYNIAISNEDDEIVISETVAEAAFSTQSLAVGDYTIDVTAGSYDEAFAESVSTTFAFTVVPSGDVPLATIITHTETFEDWDTLYEGAYMVDSDITVETYEGYVIIRGWAGVEGYDLKIEFNEDSDVTAVTTIIDGVATATVSSGYITAYTGLDDPYYASIYIGTGYTYCYSDAAEGYVALSAYFGSKYLYYYLPWEF